MSPRGNPGPCGKTGWKSERAAKRGATGVARKNGDRRMIAYLCDAKGCHEWHLTSRVGRTI